MNETANELDQPAEGEPIVLTGRTWEALDDAKKADFHQLRKWVGRAIDRQLAWRVFVMSDWDLDEAVNVLANWQ